VCKNGTQFCDGAIGPRPEVCDLLDTDCDGVADELAACPGTNACVQGVCVEPCHGGEFPCPGGYECQSFGGKSYCVPTTCNAVECPPGASCQDGKCTLDGAGGEGNAGGASGAEGGADNPAGGSSAEAGESSGAGEGGTESGGGTSGGTAASGRSDPPSSQRPRPFR
jgi:hypothetical protein